MTSINAGLAGDGHTGTMPFRFLHEFAPKSAAIAQRLRAHARLCEQCANESCNELTAAKLQRMAQDCWAAAAEIAPDCDARRQTRH